MNEKLLREWLVKYKDNVIENLKNSDDKEYFKVERAVKKFHVKLQKKEITNIDELLSILESIEILENLLFNFGPLERYSFEEYIEKFEHLLDKNKPVEDRIDAALYSSKYQLADFKSNELVELIVFNELTTYFHFHENFYPFINVLNLEKAISKRQKSKSYGQLFKAFNEIIKEEILEIFCEVFYTKNSTELNQSDLYSKINIAYEIDMFVANVLAYDKIKSINNSFINDIELKNFYSINTKGLEFKGLKDKKIIFLLGENGTGKTVLLKAMLIVLKKYFIDFEASSEDIGIIRKNLSDNKETKLNISTLKTKYEVVYHFEGNKTNQFYLKNCYAYGTQRNNISQTKKAEEYGFLTLFKPDEIITNAEFWLQDLKFQELEGRNTIKVKDFEKILGDLLDVEDLELTVSSKAVSFKINNQKKSFKELSEGYQSVINLVTDLTARLVENNNIQSIADLKATQAVVLIDELDLFLHPKWEKNICGKLHEKFPNIQFFITTHSPILIDGALKDKRIDNTSIEIIKLGLQNGETVVERRYSGDLIEDWTPNLLINSNLFDDDYLNDLDEEQVQQLKSEGNEAELLRVAKSLKIVSKREEELRQRYLKDLKSTVL